MIGFNRLLSDGITPQKKRVAEGRFLTCETTKTGNITEQDFNIISIYVKENGRDTE